jgi:hypothetical protein
MEERKKSKIRIRVESKVPPGGFRGEFLAELENYNEESC